MEKKVSKAVIPAAGRGARMLPLTRMVPKELFPVGSVPMIELAVREAVGAGVTEICIVISPKKRILRDYFEAAVFPRLRGPLAAGRISFLEQPRALGLGHALWEARRFVGREPFLMILPDQFLVGRESAARQLLLHYRFSEPTILSSVVKIARRDARHFAGSRGFRVAGGSRRGAPVFDIAGLQTEGQTRRAYRGAAFEFRGFGRTIFPAEIMPYLSARFRNPETGEVDLWETFRALPATIRHRGIVLEGTPVDIGTPAGFCRFIGRMGCQEAR